MWEHERALYLPIVYVLGPDYTRGGGGGICFVYGNVANSPRSDPLCVQGATSLGASGNNECFPVHLLAQRERQMVYYRRFEVGRNVIAAEEQNRSL